MQAISLNYSRYYINSTIWFVVYFCQHQWLQHLVLVFLGGYCDIDRYFFFFFFLYAKNRWYFWGKKPRSEVSLYSRQKWEYPPPPPKKKKTKKKTLGILEYPTNPHLSIWIKILSKKDDFETDVQSILLCLTSERSKSIFSCNNKLLPNNHYNKRSINCYFRYLFNYSDHFHQRHIQRRNVTKWIWLLSYIIAEQFSYAKIVSTSMSDIGTVAQCLL